MCRAAWSHWTAVRQGQQVGPSSGACTFAAWSPDGEWMYFDSDSGGAFHTWRQRFPDGQPEQITSGPTEEEGLAMAPDGRSFITAVGLTQSSIWLHDSRGDRRISLEGHAFQPMFTPDGKKLCYLIRNGHSSELSVADLDSDHTDPLLPGCRSPVRQAREQSGIRATTFDGREVVFYSQTARVSCAVVGNAADRRAPPLQIPSVEGEQPLFGPSGEIFFRKVEGNSAFLYSVREEQGVRLRKAAELAVVDLFWAYPDRVESLCSARCQKVKPSSRPKAALRFRFISSLRNWCGGRAMASTCSCQPDREQDQNIRFALVSRPSFAFKCGTRQKDFPSDVELAKLPGVRIIPQGNVVPGPTADVYAFTRETVQRNIPYRIPVR